MTLHSRVVPVRRASKEATEAFWNALDSDDLIDLTHLEVLGIIAGLHATALKYAMREERHPGHPDRPADAA